MAVNPIPAGFHTITPYLVIEGADRLIEFMTSAFGAALTESIRRPDGKIGHATVKIGDSMLMLAEASDQWKPVPAMLYLYVADVDATYRRTLAAGATSIMAPMNQFYGDRNAGVKDSFGNQWWIGAHVEDVPPAELQRRADEMAKKRGH